MQTILGFTPLSKTKPTNGWTKYELNVFLSVAKIMKLFDQSRMQF